MLDFHTHILPGIDDGSADVEMSLAMLHEEAAQGIDTIALTPHFYADRHSPARLIEKRESAYRKLMDACGAQEGRPKLILGSEVHYYIGIGQSSEIASLQIGNSGVLLLELPFSGKWPDALMRDVWELRSRQGLQVVIAHIERYISWFNANRIISQLLEAGAMIQANAGYFIDPGTRKKALRYLKEGRIHLIGSDCHNMTSRSPNMREASEYIEAHLDRYEYERFVTRPYRLLGI